MQQEEQMILPKRELRISITSKCNMKCVYCHNEGNENTSELKINEIRNIVEAATEYGLASVRLTGGEPLVHPELEEICRMLKEEYGFSIGINTNGILIDRLLSLVHAGIVNRVVVGIDYYNGIVSKQSPIGVPSHVILDNVIKIKEAGCDVCIDVVYQNDYENVADLVRWGIANRIRVKIIEEVKTQTDSLDNPDYECMVQRILRQFNMDCVKDIMGEKNGYIDDFRAVSFLHSLCRLRRCDICRQHMPLRITAGRMLKPCIINAEHDIALYESGYKSGLERMLKNYSYKE